MLAKEVKNATDYYHSQIFLDLTSVSDLDCSSNRLITISIDSLTIPKACRGSLIMIVTRNSQVVASRSTKIWNLSEVPHPSYALFTICVNDSILSSTVSLYFVVISSTSVLEPFFTFSHNIPFNIVGIGHIQLDQLVKDFDSQPSLSHHLPLFPLPSTHPSMVNGQIPALESASCATLDLTTFTSSILPSPSNLPQSLDAVAPEEALYTLSKSQATPVYSRPLIGSSRVPKMPDLEARTPQADVGSESDEDEADDDFFPSNAASFMDGPIPADQESKENDNDNTDPNEHPINSSGTPIEGTLEGAPIHLPSFKEPSCRTIAVFVPRIVFVRFMVFGVETPAKDDIFVEIKTNDGLNQTAVARGIQTETGTWRPICQTLLVQTDERSDFSVSVHQSSTSSPSHTSSHHPLLSFSVRCSSIPSNGVQLTRFTNNSCSLLCGFTTIPTDTLIPSGTAITSNNQLFFSGERKEGEKENGHSEGSPPSQHTSSLSLSAALFCSPTQHSSPPLDSQPTTNHNTPLPSILVVQLGHPQSGQDALHTLSIDEWRIQDEPLSELTQNPKNDQQNLVVFTPQPTSVVSVEFLHPSRFCSHSFTVTLPSETSQILEPALSFFTLSPIPRRSGLDEEPDSRTTDDTSTGKTTLPTLDNSQSSITHPTTTPSHGSPTTLHFNTLSSFSINLDLPDWEDIDEIVVGEPFDLPKDAEEGSAWPTSDTLLLSNVSKSHNIVKTRPFLNERKDEGQSQAECGEIRIERVCVEVVSHPILKYSETTFSPPLPSFFVDEQSRFSQTLAEATICEMSAPHTVNRMNKALSKIISDASSPSSSVDHTPIPQMRTHFLSPVNFSDTISPETSSRKEESDNSQSDVPFSSIESQMLQSIGQSEIHITTSPELHNRASLVGASLSAPNALVSSTALSTALSTPVLLKTIPFDSEEGMEQTKEGRMKKEISELKLKLKESERSVAFLLTLIGEEKEKISLQTELARLKDQMVVLQTENDSLKKVIQTGQVEGGEELLTRSEEMNQLRRQLERSDDEVTKLRIDNLKLNDRLSRREMKQKRRQIVPTELPIPGLLTPKLPSSNPISPSASPMNQFSLTKTLPPLLTTLPTRTHAQSAQAANPATTGLVIPQHLRPLFTPSQKSSHTPTHTPIPLSPARQQQKMKAYGSTTPKQLASLATAFSPTSPAVNPEPKRPRRNSRQMMQLPALKLKKGGRERKGNKGKKSFGGLHLHDTTVRNPYMEAIDILGKTLEPFDDDNMIPVFYFGDEETQDKFVKPFYADHVCHGFGNVLERYIEITPTLKLSGPTDFSPLIREAMKICDTEQGYHILVILTDGQCNYEKKTIDAIVEASNYPLCITCIGLGDGPWDKMETFDDRIPKRLVDNFNFVDYFSIKRTQTQNFEAALAYATLNKIPSHFRAVQNHGLEKNLSPPQKMDQLEFKIPDINQE
ncbi:putative E3 ubiquitin-protein ligase RGLG5 [Blattamonas nauphoetae]|uniref:E3 ubiquitin-protein ligase RGLG5 n=1 Tax=Blattamonas nauphoetae TaxID=2049346 RepID=A0ABQ9X6E5_9EUKA|nr:putative E3 ubiquitin-protein ligase RGLG5 [Blattamonas nauphoetae]